MADRLRKNVTQDLPPLPLPDGVSSKYITVHDLVIHFLEAVPTLDTHTGKQDSSPAGHPLLILVHGFPELAYSWRHLLRPLADLGYRVIAPDLRGYGRTIPISAAEPYPYTYESKFSQFSLINIARDIIALVIALGHESAACIIGHDFGSAVAGSCALVRPDVFRSVVLLSAPFPGAPGVPSSVKTFSSQSDALTASSEQPKFSLPRKNLDFDALFAGMDPPRIHYQHYYSLPQANEHMHKNLSPTDLRTFLSSYFYVKSASWPANNPTALKAWTKEEAARLPPYYLLLRGQSMPDAVNAYRTEGADLERNSTWLSEVDLDVYALEYCRTGFQGGLNGYRCVSGVGRVGDTVSAISVSGEDHLAALSLFTRRTVDVPALFVAGAKDWGPFQGPGELERMRQVCPLMKAGDKGIVFVDGAGHWVQQEKPNEVFQIFKAFLNENDK